MLLLWELRWAMDAQGVVEATRGRGVCAVIVRVESCRPFSALAVQARKNSRLGTFSRDPTNASLKEEWEGFFQVQISSLIRECLRSHVRLATAMAATTQLSCLALPIFSLL